jgi:hypothetical protein
MPNVNTNRRVFSNTYISPYLIEWYNSLSVKPSKGLLRDLNSLMDGLASNAIYPSLDLFHPIGGMETDEQRLRPIKTTSSTKTFTAVNSPTLNVNGVTGDGATNYINTNWNPSTNGVAYTLNSAFYGVYSRTQGALGANAASVWDGTNINTLNTRFTDDRFYGRINQSAGTSFSVANTDGRGLFVVKRTASNAVALFKNGSSIATASDVSTARPVGDLYLCSRNNSGTADSFWAGNAAAIFAGGALSTANELIYYNLIQAYMTARGINV